MSGFVAVSEWDAHYAAGRNFRPVMSEEQTVFERHVGTGDGLSALDVGCGTGEFAAYLNERGYNVLGVDYAETAVSLARSRYQGTSGLSFQCWNAEGEEWATLPVYDVISSRLSYAFIQEKGEFLKMVRDHLMICDFLAVVVRHCDVSAVAAVFVLFRWSR
ncbi:class I SAM-dependent methyltransferase [Streptomyces sp. NPDC056831]|uniref:class I SAM-dependent methyltransferase n=1 Tax=Streptomyces sp. NPDC056831 TaxID=3345954 RepID=UPI0036A2D268